jgi:hypothetical protein
MDYTRVLGAGRANLLKYPTFNYHPDIIPQSCIERKVQGSSKPTLNSTFDVDPFVLGCFSTTNLLPRPTFIHQRTNKELQAFIIYMDYWFIYHNKNINTS